MYHIPQSQGGGCLYVWTNKTKDQNQHCALGGNFYNAKSDWLLQNSGRMALGLPRMNVSQGHGREHENLPTVRDSDLQFTKACLTPTTTMINLFRKQRQWQN